MLITMRGTASTVELPPLQQSRDWVMPLSRCWDAGKVMYINCTSRQQLAAISRCLVVDTGTTEPRVKDNSNDSHT